MRKTKICQTPDAPSRHHLRRCLRSLLPQPARGHAYGVFLHTPHSSLFGALDLIPCWRSGIVREPLVSGLIPELAGGFADTDVSPQTAARFLSKGQIVAREVMEGREVNSSGITGDEAQMPWIYLSMILVCFSYASA